MKRILTIFICACSVLVSMRSVGKAQAQSSNLQSALGGSICVSPNVTITQTSPTTVLFTESIPANTLLPNKIYHLIMWFKLTTPLTGIPGITLTFQYGSQTYTALNSALTVGSITNQLFMVDFKIIASATNAQTPIAIISQPGGNILTLSSTNYSSVGAWTVDSTTAQTLTVSAVMTGTGLGTSSLNNFAYLRNPF